MLRDALVQVISLNALHLDTPLCKLSERLILRADRELCQVIEQGHGALSGSLMAGRLGGKLFWGRKGESLLWRGKNLKRRLERKI